MVQEVTRLLLYWRDGDKAALGALTPLIYDELHRIARRHMRAERASHTLQATALVNEAFERLVDADVDWQGRAHFVAVAARLMRRILVDYARGRQRHKRDSGGTNLCLDEALVGAPEKDVDLVALDDALTRFAEIDERKCNIVELHFFGGLTYDETAEVLGVSTATVARELRLAKAWLARCLQGTGSADG